MELLLYFVHNLTYTGLLNTAILKNMIFEILNYRLKAEKLAYVKEYSNFEDTDRL